MSKKFVEFLALQIRQILTVARLTHFDVYIQTKKSRWAMDIQVDYEYLRAYVRIGNEPYEQWERGDREGIISSLCHEISHIITGLPTHESEEREDHVKYEEQATEMVGRMLYRLYTFERR